MTHVERSALVRVPAERMYALVNAVADYPRRFDWCIAAEVLSADDTSMHARLQVKMAGMQLTFATRNRLEPGRAIELTLAEGPFSSLSGRWDFTALAADACKVSLRLDFEVAGKLFGGALAGGFRVFADRLVDDFVREARRDD